jgi:centromere/kinetochore protein ZW10
VIPPPSAHTNTIDSILFFCKWCVATPKGKLNVLVTATAERAKLLKECKGTEATIRVLQTLCSIDKLLSGFEDELEQGHIKAAAAAVSEAQGLLATLNPGAEAGCDPKIFTAVREDLFRKLAHVKEKLDDMWRKAIVWHQGAKPGLHILVQVEASDGRRDVALDEILGGMAVFGTLETRIEEFCKRALQVVFDPLCATSSESGKCMGPEIATSSKQAALTLVEVAVKKASSAGGKSSKKKKEATDAVLCNDLYGRITKALAFITTHLKADTTELLGANLWPALALVIQKAISDHIPSKHTLAAKFDSVLDQTSAFENEVVALGLISSEAAAANVLVNFVEKTGVARASSSRREEILEAARDILAPCSGDNYNMINTVEVEHETERGGLFLNDEDEDPIAAAGGLNLSESLYKLPKCKISVPTQSLVDFAYHALSEMSEADPDGAIVTFYGVRLGGVRGRDVCILVGEGAVQLWKKEHCDKILLCVGFSSSHRLFMSHFFLSMIATGVLHVLQVRDMFDLFRAIVPTRNKASLAQYPQLCAIFHNDCFYIAHHLLTLGHQFRAALPKVRSCSWFVRVCGRGYGV